MRELLQANERPKRSALITIELHCCSRPKAATLGVALSLSLTTYAQAQTATTQSVELPPVVVEGATLAKPKAAIKKTRPQVSDDAEPAAAKPAIKMVAKSKTGASGSAATSATPAVPPATTAEPADQNGIDSIGTPGQTAGVGTDAIGTAVSVVTASDIEAAQQRAGADVLRGLPGVSISQQGGAGSVAVARIRGAESNHTLVLVDGVEVNSRIDGFFDFANLATDDIEQIEVLRGPQSGLYGSGALGGVINIVTKSGKGPARFIAEAEGGSFNTRAGRVGVSGGTDTAWGSFMVSSRHADGFNIAPQGVERDGSDLKTLSFKGGISPTRNFTVSGSFRASRLDSAYDNYDSIYGADGLPVIGDVTAVDAPNRSENEMWSGRIAADLSLFDDAWTQQVFATRSNRDFYDVSFPSWLPGASENRLIDDALTYGYKSTIRIGPKHDGAVRHFLTGLVERREESFDQPTSADFHAERGRTSFVGEVRGEYFNTLYLGGSLRRDLNETFDDVTDWRIDGSLKVPMTPFRLHTSYGTGTKLPSFAELYGTFSRYTPNPDLKPERSKGWDVGVETTLLGGRGVVDVTYFNTDLTNEITEDFSQFPLISSINLDGRSKRQGIEVSGRFKLVAGITLGASYTWLDAVDDKGLQELRRPEHQARFDVDWRSEDARARLNLATIYNGTMPDFASAVVGYGSGPFGSFPIYLNDTRMLDEYWLVRLSGSYELKPGLEAFARVENLLDANYQEVFGYQSAGIAAYAGLRLKLEADLSPPAAWK